MMDVFKLAQKFLKTWQLTLADQSHLPPPPALIRLCSMSPLAVLQPGRQLLPPPGAVALLLVFAAWPRGSSGGWWPHPLSPGFPAPCSRFPSCPSCIPSHPLAGSSPSAYAGCSVVPQGSVLGPLLSSHSVLFPVDGVSVTPMVSVVIYSQMASKPSSQGHTLLPTQLIKPTGLSPFQLGFLRGNSCYKQPKQYPSASSCRRAPRTFTKLGLAPPPTVLPAQRPAASSLVPLALVPSITPFSQFNLQYIFVDPSTPQHSQCHHPRPSPYEISYLITPTFFESSHR